MVKIEENKQEEKPKYDLYTVRDGKRSVAVEKQTELSLVSTEDLIKIQLKRDLLKEIQMYWIGDSRLWSKTREMILAMSMDQFDVIWSKVRWWTINIHRPELTPDLDTLLNNPELPTSELCAQQKHWTRLINPDKLSTVSEQIIEQLQKLRDQEMNSLK
jgi:hypothetical protein